MKVYVAGKWDDRSTINTVQAELVKMGHHITHDWTSVECISKSQADRAVLDINGVQKADAVLVLMLDETYPYRGTFTEIGCALGLNKYIVVVCPNDSYFCTTNCFYHHPMINHVATIDQALELFRSFSPH
jgi:nucleoside 2-deoxyribosyltransferase